MTQNTINKYYIYIHKRKSNNSIFYVGLGNKRRAWDFINRSEYWKRIANKHDVIVEIIYDNLSIEDAYSLEKETIVKYNPVANFTAGGNGGNTLIKKTEQEILAIRKKQSDALKGRKLGQYSEQRCKNISLSRKDKKRIQCIETSEVFESIRECSKKLKIDYGNLKRLLKARENGKIKKLKGFTFKLL